MKRIAGIILAVVMIFSFTGCKKTESALDGIVAKVNDVEIKRGEVEELLNAQLGYYVSFLDKETLASYREQCLDILIQQEAARIKAAELGFYTLTEEEQKEADEIWENVYESNIEYYISQLKTEDSENGVPDETIETKDYTEDAEKAFEEYLQESQKYTFERFDGKTYIEKYESYVRDNYVIGNKLYKDQTKDVTVEESAVKEKYDSLLAEQKEKFDSDITAYEDAVSQNITYMAQYGMNYSTITYVPEGLRYVKHILIKFSDEKMESLGTLYQTMYTKETSMNTAKDTMDSAEEDIEKAEDDEAKATAQTEYESAVEAYETAKTEYETAKKEYDDALEEAKPEIAEELATVKQKVDAGEDFDKLIEEYGKDPGMENEPYKENGYLLSAESTTYYEEFSEAGMALENVGDISEPVYTTAGAHIIRFDSIVTPGEIAYDEVKDEIEADLLAEAQNERFYELLEEWTDAIKVERYEDALSASIAQATASPSNQ